MSRIASKKSELRLEGEPAWDIAQLYPRHGAWTEEEYLALDTNHLIELSNGQLVVLPMPTYSHQALLLYLYGLLSAFVGRHNLGEVCVAALPVRLWKAKYREPDILFMLKEHVGRIRDEY